MNRQITLFTFLLFFFSIPLFSQLSLQDGTNNYLINLDATVASVNQGTFTSSGLNIPPSSGQLDGNAWGISGMSEGSHQFGQINTSGDFARGNSSGGVGTGGLYAFDVGGNNKAIGIQPTGSDWTPGAICLKIVNNQSTSIDDMDIDYTVYVYNDQNRANSFNFSYSTDNINYTTVSSASLTSPSNADGSPSWTANNKSISLTNLALAPGASFYFKWSGTDAGGSGSRDEFALDDISITTTGNTNNCVEPTAQSSNLSFGTITANSIQATFTGATADKYLVVQSTSSSLSANPVDGVNYSAGNTIGNGEVIQYSSSSMFTSSGLAANTPYYFFIFSGNDNCVGGPDYLNTNPLTGTATTNEDNNGDYYASVNGETCAALKTVLYNIIKDHVEFSYANLWTIYQDTDDHLNDNGNEVIVWDMYSDNPDASENEFTFVNEQCGTYSTEGDCYNREHSFPKSWWGGATNVAQYTDIFVVVPVDGWINGVRNNNPYGIVQAGAESQITNNGSKLGPSAISIPGYGGNVFEPIDAYKGDFARNYFYMLTRYENEIASWENNTVESDAVMDGLAYPGLEQWAIDMLIDWHNADPVSAKEIDRNNTVFTYQQNRNPFIDHPEYVAAIWLGCNGEDTEAPTAPGNLTASNTTETTTNLSWNLSTDNTAVTGYQIYQNGSVVFTTNASTSNATIGGLSPSTTYSFYVTAIDAAANESLASNSVSVTTQTPAGDTEAPTAPTTLTASNTTEISTDLNWNASNDNVGVVGYNIYQDGIFASTTTTTFTTINGLTAATNYVFYVTALDAAGNESAASNNQSVTTDTPADTEAPSSPTSLTASNTTETSTDLSWNASTDNIGVTGYNIYQDGVNVSTSTGTSTTISGLTASSTYIFFVTAIDAAGNESASSSNQSVTTDTPAGGPTVLHEGYFESGWDNWIDGGSDAARYSGSRSSEGSYSIRLRDNSGTKSSMTSENFDLTSFNTVEVAFSFYPHSFENSEDFWLRYFDGSSWTTVATYVRNVDFVNGNYYTATVTLNSANYNFASNSQFRFQADASGNNDQVYIDAVVITGDPTGGQALIGPAITYTMDYQLEAVEIAHGENTSDLEVESIANNPIKNETIHTYPNPAFDYINIDLNGFSETIKSIEIYNVLGQRLIIKENINDNIERFDVSAFESGFYLIRVIDSKNEIKTHKFLVK